jgi:translation initiation factor IF-2
MAIRVYDLAKEFKISTSALRSHLKEMGIEVKSPMSHLDDEIVSKIRLLFQAEVDAVKQQQADRKTIQQKLVMTKEKITSESPREEIKKETLSKPIPQAPVFIEKQIKKEERRITNEEHVRPPIESKTPISIQEKSPEIKEEIHIDKKPVFPKPKENISSRFIVTKEKITPTKRPEIIKPKIEERPVKKVEVHFEKKVEQPVIPILPDFIVNPEQKRLKDDKFKKKEKETDEQGKHLKAKLKNIQKKSKRTKVFEPTEFEEAEINKTIKKTLQETLKKKKFKKEEKEQETFDSKIKISEFTSVSELAKLMDVSATEIISKFFSMGQMVTINQRLDRDSLEMICAEFQFDVEFQDEYGREVITTNVNDKNELDFETRPPIVTIMGHVDHGKTSILDFIRSSNVIAGESGGITQHIGAYQVKFKNKSITFLDTPGHEAFTAMRARGANITDIAIIVVAANESVKPQTIEAIDHAKAAGVTIILAINKIDLNEANLDRTISDLMKQNLMLEGYGGDILWTTCSAKTGEGVNDLLELILLSAEIMELRAAKGVSGKGVVIEAEKDTRMGTIVTLLLQEGELKKGDNIVCGATFGRVRRLEDERGNEMDKIRASDVALLYGLNSVPKAGDILNKVDHEKIARQISTERLLIRQEREKYHGKTNLNNLFQKIKEHEMSDIRLIIKADTDGSVDVLADSLQKLSNDEVVVNIIRKAVGGINEADVSLASASDAIILGFHVRTSNAAKKLAEEEKIDIRIYHIIYELIDHVKSAMQGMLKPLYEEKYLGSAIIRQLFRIKKVGVIAGCYVEKGIIKKDSKIRIFRNDVMIHEGNLATLKHFAELAVEVKAGSECGISVEGYNDIKEGDVVENYVVEQVTRKL